MGGDETGRGVGPSSSTCRGADRAGAHAPATGFRPSPAGQSPTARPFEKRETMWVGFRCGSSMVNTQNTGNQGGNVGGNMGQKTGNVGGQQQGGMGQQKFVPRFEMAIMQFVILNKAKQGGVTRENLQQLFRGNLQMSSDHLQHCIQQLVSDGHLKEEGNRFTITDDGREDVQKLQHLVIELPSIVNGGMQGGQKGPTQQQAVGGQSMGGNVGTGGSTGQGSTGQTTGNTGNLGTSGRGNVDTGEEINRGSVNKGGATSPSGQQGKGNQNR